MPAPSLTLLVLKTRQVEELQAFYGALGIELIQERHGSGPTHFAGRVGEVTFEVYPIAHERDEVDSTTRLGFVVDNLAGVIEALEMTGRLVSSPPKETPWGVRAVARDPDGRAVELYERRTPDV